MPATPEQRLLEESARARPADGHPSPGLVVLEEDGSTRNRAAVAWATREAREAGLGLLVVGVLPRSDVTPPRQPAWVQERALVRAALVEDRVRRPDRPFGRAFRLAPGTPGFELARSARPGDVVVVGRRGGGSLQRLRVGSTSLSAATFVRVPLVVVPGDWDQDRQSAGHLLVGVDGSGRRGRDGPALDFAFVRAARGALERLSLGGTARRVLQEATCPVAVVPFVASASSSQQAHHHNAQEFVA